MKKLLVSILTLWLASISIAALGESLNISDKSGQTLLPDSGMYYLTEGEYVASGNTEMYGICIEDGERVVLALDSVTIDLSKAIQENWNSAISVGKNAELVLIVKNNSANTLRGSEGVLELPNGDAANGYAALSNANGTLTIRCEGCVEDGHSCDDSCGSILAVGGYSAAGIGGNSGCDGKNITILGGRITAKGQAAPQKLGTFEFSGAGIGGGYNGEGSNITISGGIIHAEGEMDGAGIGGSCGGVGKSIEINDGIITAIGGSFAAGIGGGTNAEGKEIVISGGTVNATAGVQGAGIGGGHSARGNSISIFGGEIKAISLLEGAGIGGGTGAGAESILISGGNLIAIGGETDDWGEEIGIDGEGIGRGGYCGTLSKNQSVETSNIIIKPSDKQRISLLTGDNENKLVEVEDSPFLSEKDIIPIISDMTCVKVKTELIQIPSEDGDIVQGEEELDTLPPVDVPTLILPDGVRVDASAMLKYDEPNANGKNTVVYNVSLINQNGDELELPEGCIICFPYPKGLDENSSNKYRIIICHYADNGKTEIFKSENGDIEFAKQGLCIRVSSFSPFEITWEEQPEVDLPQTGDNSHIALWLTLLTLAGIATLTLKRKTA